ncbi:DDE superfamily endonuclease [Phytophthora infestans]|uniref:DDE superfamily endonuclease n=1 Tax=Phytophthora infestans TaxID=4787 RepID=A0A8S9U3K0_PHYIN|nr:DDE superfamily endonuclease [Phytophthora infestans]
MANGLIVSMLGPIEERCHDGFILRESEIVDDMANHIGYHNYGDQGYPLKSWLITPFSDPQRTVNQRDFNRDLSRVRIAVEWSFGWIWKFFSLITNMKVLKSPIATLFIIATFLTNCLSCVRRKNQASKYFRCRLPTLAVYLADLNSGEAIDEDDYPSDDDILEFFDDESDMSSGDESSDSDDKTDD